MISYRHIFLDLANYCGINFWPCFFYLQLSSFLVVMTIFGKPRDLKTTPKTQAAYILFDETNKKKKIECI